MDALQLAARRVSIYKIPTDPRESDGTFGVEQHDVRVGRNQLT